MSNSNKAKRYSDEFKQQIVLLVRKGKTPLEISKEYNIARSTINKWTNDFTSSGSFKTKDNRSEEEKELLKLRKENQQLKMENDILKQAALIMGRKSK